MARGTRSAADSLGTSGAASEGRGSRTSPIMASVPRSRAPGSDRDVPRALPGLPVARVQPRSGPSTAPGRHARAEYSRSVFPLPRKDNSRRPSPLAVCPRFQFLRAIHDLTAARLGPATPGRQGTGLAPRRVREGARGVRVICLPMPPCLDRVLAVSMCGRVQQAMEREHPTCSSVPLRRWLVLPLEPTSGGSRTLAACSLSLKRIRCMRSATSSRFPSPNPPPACSSAADSSDSQRREGRHAPTSNHGLPPAGCGSDPSRRTASRALAQGGRAAAWRPRGHRLSFRLVAVPRNW